MPTFVFERGHIMIDVNTTTIQNVLIEVELAQYTVLANNSGVWSVQLSVPAQGVTVVNFYPAAGGSFTPQAGLTPPLGIVDRIEFLDAAQIVVAISAIGMSATQILDQGFHANTQLTLGDDIFLGSPEADEFYAGEGADLLDGGAGDDILLARNGDDVAFGGDGADRLVGLFGNDTLRGGPGDDVLEGGDDDDFLWGGPGNDFFNGGPGRDVVSYADAPSGVTVSLGFGTFPQDTGAAGIDTIAIDTVNGLEGSAFDDRLTGYTHSETFYGFDGDDVIDGGSGQDELYGGDGDDVLSSEAGVLSGGAGDDSFVAMAGLILGGDGDDVIVLERRFNTAPAVFGGDEAADSGFDTVDFSTDFDFLNLTINLISGDVTFGVTLLAEISGIEAIIATNSQDTIIGDAENNLLEGGLGVDWVEGGAGDDWLVQGIEHSTLGVDRLSGDGGFDTIDFDGVSAGVVVQLSGYATSGGATVALFSGIEAAVGSAFDDALIGGDNDNRLIGGAGSDWIVGSGGDDWFVQQTSSGVDRLFGDAGTDTIDYIAAASPVIVQLNGWAALGDGATLATFLGIENAVGGSFNDALIGSAANNRITGGLGGDWLVGGDGDDIFVQAVETSGVDTIFGGTPGADSGLDGLDYSGSGAGVVVQLSGYATTNDASRTLLATFSGIESVIGTGFDDALIGDGAANEIRGGDGADWLVGGGGADRLHGGEGEDRFLQTLFDSAVDQFFGDSGTDTIDYSQAHAGVVVQLSGYATTNDSALTLLSTFFSIENAVGSNNDDALIGNAADNVIVGLQGADWLVGGAGADRFFYSSASDGTDSVRDFSRAENDRIDLAAIDANASQGGDQAFTFSETRTAGVLGEAVVTTFASSTLVSLYLDGDNVSDMTIQVVHQPGLIMNAGDFIL